MAPPEERSPSAEAAVALTPSAALRLPPQVGSAEEEPPAPLTAAAARVARSVDSSQLPVNDPGLEIASRGARLLVFVILCQGVQMFMSYDGGAVPASLDTLQALFDNAWTEFELGLLGAMDKVGMVVASVPWGWALQRCNAKWLLATSLFVNALVSFVFGWLPTKELMFAAKFIMGATQSLQGVWGTVWTVNLAPPDRKTMWLGWGAISAGIGNGIGTAVAGFGTANGLPFSFAFQLAGGILGALWVVQLFFPPRWLQTSVPAPCAERNAQSANGAAPAEEESTAATPLTSASDASNVGGDHPLHDVSTTRSPRLSASPTAAGANAAVENGGSKASTTESLSMQLRALLRNRIYVGTAMAISLCMFEVSGLQYLWTRVYTQVWMVTSSRGLSKNWVTAMFIVVTGGGGGLGIAFGPWIIDRRGGFSQPPGVLRSLRVLWYFQLLAALSGLIGVAALYGKFHPWGYNGEWGDAWLWISWASVFLVYAAHNASVAALCGINLQVVPEHMREFASGTEITVRNVLGYIGGPLIPGAIMMLNGSDTEDADAGARWRLTLGFSVVLLANCLGIAILGRLCLASRLDLGQQRMGAITALRVALQSEDPVALESAIACARRLELEKWKHGDGEAVMGMANELVGRWGAQSEEGRQQQHAALTLEVGAREHLQQRVLTLEREVQRQQLQIAQQQQEILRLRAGPSSEPPGVAPSLSGNAASLAQAPALASALAAASPRTDRPEGSALGLLDRSPCDRV
eukprot:TRINITY_DN175_c0_g3_i1.p1 TRINITY_DN175_c0_g3~~TRINITY_DN175_c0_g3_i1.p1  ORF type:complete len:803 (-),score=167.50 TRINITY_DN175_c0_g3_i1:178-2427(-)